MEAHFIRQGFCLDASTHIDLICWHPATGEKWQIEAKGMTWQPGLDFRTCLGQLVQRMQDGDVHYAIALPNEPKYLAQIEKTSTWAVKQLNIRWLLVDGVGRGGCRRGDYTDARGCCKRPTTSALHAASLKHLREPLHGSLHQQTERLGG